MTSLKHMWLNNDNSKKCSSRVHKVSTLGLGEPNITIEVYKNLTDLLIITFNIEAISSHPDNSHLVGSKVYVLSINLTSSSRKP